MPDAFRSVRIQQVFSSFCFRRFNIPADQVQRDFNLHLLLHQGVCDSHVNLRVHLFQVFLVAVQDDFFPVIAIVAVFIPQGRIVQILFPVFVIVIQGNGPVTEHAYPFTRNAVCIGIVELYMDLPVNPASAGQQHVPKNRNIQRLVVIQHGHLSLRNRSLGTDPGHKFRREHAFACCAVLFQQLSQIQLHITLNLIAVHCYGDQPVSLIHRFIINNMVAEVVFMFFFIRKQERGFPSILGAGHVVVADRPQHGFGIFPFHILCGINYPGFIFLHQAGNHFQADAVFFTAEVHRHHLISHFRIILPECVKVVLFCSFSFRQVAVAFTLSG